jgi:drug/metabolite transporter (DMT)-like permease
LPAAWPAHVALIFVQLFFGSLPVLGKFVLRSLDPLALVCLRIGGAVALLELFRRAARLPSVRGWKDHLALALYGLFGVSLNQVLFLEGLARTTAVNASVLTTAIPVITTLLAVVLRLERGTPLKGLGIVLSLAGALTLIGIDGLDLGSRYLIGNLLIFCNTISYSIYLVLSKPMLERYPPLSVVTLVFAYGFVEVLPVGGGTLAALDTTRVSGWTWLALVAIVVFPTVGAYLLNSWALKRTQASLVAVYIYLQPLVTTTLGVWLLHERLTLRTLEAAVLIFSGVFVVSVARRREARAITPAGDR